MKSKIKVKSNWSKQALCWPMLPDHCHRNLDKTHYRRESCSDEVGGMDQACCHKVTKKQENTDNKHGKEIKHEQSDNMNEELERQKHNVAGWWTDGKCGSSQLEIERYTWGSGETITLNQHEQLMNEHTHKRESACEMLAQNSGDLECGWLNGSRRVVANWHY